MIFLSLLLLAQAGTTPAPQKDVLSQTLEEQSAELVTVTAPSLKATGDALEHCLARACPPQEDIAASLAHAENLVIAGELQDARSVLLKARGRNSRHAAALPVPVSTLHAFNADVASLLGLPDPARIGTIDSVSALKKGLPADDPRIAAQRLRVADVFLREGRVATAVRMYDAVAERAEEAGWAEIQGMAMFRSLMVYATLAQHNSGYKGQARRRYAALRGTTQPVLQPTRDATYLLEARLRLLNDKNSNVDAVLKKMRGIRTVEPMLVVEPTIDMRKLLPDTVTPSIAQSQWIDVGYRITPEGKVADVEMRQGPKARDPWVDAVRRAIENRRYLPLAVPNDAAGLWRRERIMIVVDAAQATGSHIPDAAGPPKLRRIDLTRGPAPASAASS
ncbi:hypothetical protein VPH46_03720 [Sphingomonas sp. MJ1 (PH-R8)]|uniref:hypothetical protein n=1 Tax=Sphingomonas sp. MJ1 (PH-R8) TaxID=3112950 RepID=UPI003A886E01